MACDLASRGCKVIIADIQDGERQADNIIKLSRNPNVSYKYINLASFDSIRQFAKEINESEEKLDILINNAGSFFFKNIKTEDGCNLGMQVNHFGSFLLTHLLIGEFFRFSIILFYS